MNLADLLLNADEKQVTKKATCEYEVTRLSALLGVPFKLTLEEIPAKRYAEIQNEALQIKKGRVVGADISKTQALLVADAIACNGLASNDVLKKYGVATPAELYTKLFNAGEIATIANKVQDLSGIKEKDEEVEEVKN